MREGIAVVMRASIGTLLRRHTAAMVAKCGAESQRPGRPPGGGARRAATRRSWANGLTWFIEAISKTWMRLMRFGLVAPVDWLQVSSEAAGESLARLAMSACASGVFLFCSLAFFFCSLAFGAAMSFVCLCANRDSVRSLPLSGSIAIARG